jgi:hypothetical protein
MKPSDLARTVPLGPHPPKDAALLIAIAFGYAAEHFYVATLENGGRPLDMLDVKVWLKECAEAFSLAESHIAISAETSSGAPRKLRLDGSTDSRDSRFYDICHRCGHVHEGRICGREMGANRICPCELEGVPA